MATTRSWSTVRILGVVPLLGRHSLAGRRIGDATLTDRAVDLLGRVCSSVLIVTSDEAARPIAEPDVLHDARLVALPSGHDALSAELAAADLVVVHDPLCPLVPVGFVRRLVDAATPDSPAVAVRPVVDTIKATVDGAVAGTVDREGLRVVSSPIVVAAETLAALEDLEAILADPVDLVVRLRRSCDVQLVVAPSSARRAEDASGLALLDSVDAVGRRVRERDTS